jgi:SAM-dependent methyltransferase
MEKSSFFYSLLKHPRVYELAQHAVVKRRHGYLLDYLSSHHEIRTVLDLGCGTGSVSEILVPRVSYVGIDYNQGYVDGARKRSSSRAKFLCTDLEYAHEALRAADLPTHYDLILLAGVLHHLQDDLALTLLRQAPSLLSDAGRVLSIDPTYTAAQNPIARFLVSRDRGPFVRNVDGYLHLYRSAGLVTHSQVLTNQLRVPYNHCLIEAFPAEPVGARSLPR